MQDSYPQLVKLGSKWIFQDQRGKQIINLLFDQAREFNEGLAAVCIDKKWGYINQQGEVVVNFQFGLAESFSEGLAAVGHTEEYTYHRREYDDDGNSTWQKHTGYNDKYGYMNKEGQLIIPIQYDEVATQFYQGVAIVGINSKTDEGGWRIYQNYFFIDQQGKKFSEVFSSLDYRAFSEGFDLAPICHLTNKKYGFINQAGKIIIPIKFDGVQRFCGQFTYVQLNGKYGAIDKTGTVVIPIKFDYINHSGNDNGFAEGLLAVSLNNKWGYINKNLDFIIQPQFDYASSFQGGLASVRIAQTDSKGQAFSISGYINRNAQFFGTSLERNILVNKITDFQIVPVTDVSGKYGYINRDFELCVPFQFDSADSFSVENQELARVKKDGKWGYINKQGQIVIKPKFYDAQLFDKNGTAKVKIKPMFLGIFPQDYTWITIDKTGNIIEGLNINYLNLTILILSSILIFFWGAKLIEYILYAVNLSQKLSLQNPHALNSNVTGAFLSGFLLAPIVLPFMLIIALVTNLMIFITYSGIILVNMGLINVDISEASDFLQTWHSANGMIVIFFSGASLTWGLPVWFSMIKEIPVFIKNKIQYIHEKNTNKSGSIFNILALLTAMFISAKLVDLGSQSSKRYRTLSSSKINLSYKSSCGSYSKKTKQWYAVVGDRASLNTVKSRYCADSFIRKDRNVQVASFTSEQEAQQFANALQKATGYQFWVKLSVRK